MLVQKAYKGRIFLTKEQEKQVLVNLEAAKRAYNYGRHELAEDIREKGKPKEAFYQTIKHLPKSERDKKLKEWSRQNEPKYISVDDVSKRCTAYRKVAPHWIELAKQDYVAQAVGCTIRENLKVGKNHFWDNLAINRERAYRKYKKRLKIDKDAKLIFPEHFGFPRKKYSAKSYRCQVAIKNVDYETNRLFLPKVGWIRINKNQPLPFIQSETKKGQFYVRIKKEGKKYFIIFSTYIAVEKFDKPQTDILGVDLGLKEVAILSNGMHIDNISKSEKYKKIQEKIKKLNKKKCWLVEHSPKSWNIENKKEKWKAADSIQLRTLTERVSKLYYKLNCLKLNYMHEQAEKIVRENPKGLIFEKLNVKAMQQNKKLSSSVQETGMSLFKTILIWHATKHGIPCKEANPYFASTQICSVCGKKNTDIKGLENLGKRTFTCPHCNAIIDRDENAAINLRKEYDAIPNVVESQNSYIEILNIS